MKKTLLITTDFWPQTGGVANYWLELGRRLPQDQFVVLAPQLDGRQDEVDGLSVRRVRFFNRFIWPHWLPLLWHILSFVKKEKIEKIIVGQILPVGTAVWILHKLGLAPAYHVSCHGMDLQLLQGRKKKLAQLIFRSAEGIMVNSDYTLKLVRQLIYHKRIYKINPCPRSLPISSVDIKHEFGLTTDNVLLTVARLVERKGIDKVIEALPQIWYSFPDVIYMIVGDGPDKLRLQKLVKEKIIPSKRSQIIWAGNVDDDKLSAFYQAAKIFIMPNREIGGDIEGFGMVFLEAGLFALPVIGGRSGGVVEAIKEGESGFLVDPLDVRQIAASVVKLLENNDLYQQLSQGSYQWAHSFNWDKEGAKLKEQLA